jgi:hypothetical protein
MDTQYGYRDHLGEDHFIHPLTEKPLTQAQALQFARKPEHKWIARETTPSRIVSMPSDDA